MEERTTMIKISDFNWINLNFIREIELCSGESLQKFSFVFHSQDGSNRYTSKIFGSKDEAENWLNNNLHN